MDFPLLIFVADDLSSLFEKKDFKDRPRSTGSKSTLSLRLEQCPQQLNNPFNEYSKFDGKVSTSVSRLSTTFPLKGLKAGTHQPDVKELGAMKADGVVASCRLNRGGNVLEHV